MVTKPQRTKRQDNALPLLNAAVEAMNLAKEISSMTPAKAVFGSVSILLTMIRVRFSSSPVRYRGFTRNQDSMANKADYVELGLACADVCRALDRGMNERRMDELGRSVLEAIGQLTRRVKLGMHTAHDLLTMFSTIGPWRRSRER